MEIIKLTAEQYQDSMELSMYAFQYKIKDEDIPKRKEMLKNHKILGVYQQEQLAAKLHIIPLEIIMPGGPWKMGGIAGVATYPEFRRKGLVNALLKEALREIKEEGQIVSFLHPFDIAFYRKFGWEIFTENRQITIQCKDLQFVGKANGTINRFSKETHTREIEDIYHSYATRFTGMLARDRDWWNHNIYQDEKVAVYYDENNNEAKGYILYKIKDRKMDVQELVVLNQEAREGLWNFVCQHDSMVDTVTLLVSVHDPFPYFLKQPKQKTEVYPYFMARIVDAEECLKRYVFRQGSESVFIHLEDDIAPWNNGSYLIGGTEVKVFKEKSGSTCTHRPKKGISLNINTLTAILFGYKRPNELFELGYIEGNSSEVDKLEHIIPYMKPFFYDFF